jgi:hypothetical protein
MLFNDFLINKLCLSMTAVKKRTVFIENFQVSSNRLSFKCINGAVVCIVCNASISVLKQCSIKRHYKPKHMPQLSHTQVQLGCDKITNFPNSNHTVRHCTCQLVSKILAKGRNIFGIGK